MSDTKTCRKCGVEYPPSAEYFYSDASKRDGVSTQCKSCAAQYQARYRAANPEKVREIATRYIAANREKIREQQTRSRVANPDKQREYGARYRAKHPDKVREKDARYRAENADKRRETNARYYAANADKVREYHARYQTENADKLREYRARYRAENPDKRRNFTYQRRARKRGLPAAPVNEALARDYFNHCCAVCGRPAGLWHTLAMDHWIAVSDPRPDNPGNVPTNMIPLCHSKPGANGQGSCNNSKHAKDPIAWLNQQYGKRKAAQISKRINDYFEWVRQQEQEAA